METLKKVNEDLRKEFNNDAKITGGLQMKTTFEDSLMCALKMQNTYGHEAAMNISETRATQKALFCKNLPAKTIKKWQEVHSLLKTKYYLN